MSAQIDAYIGIDITSGPKPVTFIALDDTQQPLAIGEGDLSDVLAFAAGQSTTALVAVNAAAHPTRGRKAREQARDNLSALQDKGSFGGPSFGGRGMVQGEFDMPSAPSPAERSHPSAKRGYALVERLASLGYQPFPQENAARQWLEIHADAAFAALMGVAPLPAGTLEGRIQRQLVLLDQGLKVPDAMDFFEEITRFKILKSNLPTRNIFPQAEINAWISAHTAWLAQNQPEHILRLGEADEGLVFLPCSAAK